MQQAHFTRKIAYIGFLLCVVACFCSCSVTRHLSAGEALLVKHNISCSNHKIDESDIRNYLKPQPNKVAMGFRPRLSFYFRFQNSESRFGSWMRDIVGEPPVLYDENQIKKNEEQIRLYLCELGYYNASVSSSTQYKGHNFRKAKVTYAIQSGNLFTISNLAYHIPDTNIAQVVRRRQNNSRVKVGKPFSISLLQEEQERIMRNCKNAGYYAFSKENVVFSADTTHGPDSVSLVISVKQTTENSLKCHRINELSISQESKQVVHSRPKNLADSGSRKAKKQKLSSERNASYVKEKRLRQGIFLEENEPYSLIRADITQRNISSFAPVKMVNIEFQSSAEQTQSDTILLDCDIKISPEKRQSINFEVEQTQTSGDWGFGITSSYSNRNLFHGAEYFRLKLRIAEEYNNILKTSNENLKLFNSQEYGIAMDFSTPYNKRFKTRSNLHFEYNYLLTPDYTRPTTEGEFGYTWFGKRFMSFTFNPLVISYIRYYDISERFRNFINSRNYYKYSYEDYLLYNNNVSMVFYNKPLHEARNHHYLKLYGETSGNLAYLLCKATNQPKNSASKYETFNLPFAQYVKAEADYRFYQVLSPQSSIVYRFFGGISVPYLNSNGMPSVKKYYSGGANSMRAWESRSLGIGSHVDTINSFKYYLGDIKMELNIEGRFHIFGVVNGAVFVDIGNIWSFWNDELEGSEFRLKDFYKDLAVGTGFGLRLDFSFLVLRCDLGVKVREPQPIPNTNSHIILGNRMLKSSDFNLNLGIGYPF